MAFQHLLDFAYTNKILITGENVQQLLYSASILQVKYKLQKICSFSAFFIFSNSLNYY